VESNIREKKHDEVLVDMFTVLAAFPRVHIATIPEKKLFYIVAVLHSIVIV
jgi:hypothetical protein